ncbi:MAG: valine--tRNA ligase [Anaerolineae bacterium]|nr:MAG: valine--tRNA ligase [Anaerolineae bacterium]
MTANSLPKTYDFKNTEERVYSMWESHGYFKPSNDPNHPGHDPNLKPFVISIPPPNVTGELHLGHAVFVAMEDLMIRYHRMKGIPTLWVPGSDHAGIATQLQVEKYLLQTEEVTREELGREEFLKRTWEWKQKYGSIITQQIRRLGASCDWDRERFTLDEGLSESVRDAFLHLYEKGLIYRGPRLINWSPGLKTAVSDLEVEYAEEQATLYHFKYMLAGSEDFIPVATTRPETILGDTAVAVHPQDERYSRFIGQSVIVPILGRLVPVIADEYVDREFGTGALKITPGHDMNDYAIGQRHSLPIISVLDREARINENGGKYQGMDRFGARKKIWADMETQGLTIKTVPYTLKVPRSQRGGEIVEPMISTQWFVEIKPLAEKALAAVRSGAIRIVPDHFEKVYFNWLENIQDWCISRQLWWGHRIPVWYGPDGQQFCARTEKEAARLAKVHYGKAVELEQDPDVLDTWFSSGLWPFSTLGWPSKTKDFEYFYPTSVLETGYDILFFWVARMIMMGLEFTGQPPFHTVYLHGIIRDEQSRKMSKTLGNVIDPLIVMDELGTDALRFTLLVGSTPGKDMNLSVKKVEANRNFANKVWNAGRLVISLLDQAPDSPPSTDLTLADRWIQTRHAQLIRDVERLFASHQYGEAGRQIYEFFWSEFADWYLEIAKLQVAAGGERASATLAHLVAHLDSCLRLLHPFTPFVTEELWQQLKESAMAKQVPSTSGVWPEALMIAPWPKETPPASDDSLVVSDFQLVMDIVRAIRNLRAEKQVKPGTKLAAVIAAGPNAELVNQQLAAIAALAQLDPDRTTVSVSLPEKPAGNATLVVGSVEIHLPLAEMVDPEEERARLEKELVEVEAQITRLQSLLSGDFANKAPTDVVSRERARLDSFVQTAERLKSQIDTLK